MNRNDESFFDQISGESDTHDVPLDEKVDKMVQDMNAMSDHADEVLKKAEAFADMARLSRALDDEWTPQLGEKVIGTLQNGKCAIGKYVEKSQVGIHHYIETDYFDEQQVQWCVHVEKWYQEEISVSELVAFYSQHTGTNVELIKVKR